MAELVAFIWSWLERGFISAHKDNKSIWAETKAILKMAMDALTSFSKQFQAYFSYSREESWKEENGAGVKVC